MPCKVKNCLDKFKQDNGIILCGLILACIHSICSKNARFIPPSLPPKKKKKNQTKQTNIYSSQCQAWLCTMRLEKDCCQRSLIHVILNYILESTVGLLTSFILGSMDGRVLFPGQKNPQLPYELVFWQGFQNNNLAHLHRIKEFKIGWDKSFISIRSNPVVWMSASLMWIRIATLDQGPIA